MATMKIHRLSRGDYGHGQWSGGSTTQFYIYPPGSDYAARRFALRVSSATVNVPESDFTPLQGVTRYITPLTGSFTLTHPDAVPVVMSPLDPPYRFSGDTPTHCIGTATDFNLMLKGVEGEMEICRETGVVLPGLNCFYPLGDVRFLLNGEEYPMGAGELLVVFSDEPAVLTAPGGQFIRCFGAVGADAPACERTSPMEKTEVIFVPATEADAPTIARLRQTVWRTTYRGIFPDAMIDDFAYDWHTERDLRRIKSPDYAVWLMVTAGKHIGYLILKKDSPVLLNSLYILPEYQRQGLGKRALIMTGNYCLQNGEREFICHCQPENKNAMSFYEKMGGVIAGLDLDNEERWQNSVIWRFAVETE